LLLEHGCFYRGSIPYLTKARNEFVNFHVKKLFFTRSSDVLNGFTVKLAEYFMGFLANFGQFTWNNAGSDNSITAFVFKASLADLCNSPLKNGITSTAAKRTKKKT
jgi:hypothetical protein